MLRRLVTQAELPQPTYNVVVLGKELDLYWPEARLGIEVDAYGTHGGRAAFEDDRKVDADLEKKVRESFAKKRAEKEN